MVYVFLADGFEECEAVAPIDMLRRAGAEVLVAAVGSGALTVTGSRGIKIIADVSEGEVKPELTEMIILPGGSSGVEGLSASACVRGAIEYCVQNSLPIGAICAAPSILAGMGLLRGRRAACHPSFEGSLIDGGAELVRRAVVIDGIFTTASGAGLSVEFGLECAAVLRGREAADKIREAIVGGS